MESDTLACHIASIWPKCLDTNDLRHVHEIRRLRSGATVATRRTVLTVFDWTPDIITDWLTHGQPYLDDGIDLFPSERGALVAERSLLRRFRRYCNDLELSAGLDLHSFQRSYITHLIEDGWDAKFVQDQPGHDYASTTSLYTGVSSDFRTRTLRRVLDQTVEDALSFGEETS